MKQWPFEYLQALLSGQDLPKFVFKASFVTGDCARGRNPSGS